MVLTLACQPPPRVATSAKPNESRGPAPMGSATSNEAMKLKVQVLRELLAGKISPDAISAAVAKADGLTKNPPKAPTEAQLRAVFIKEMLARLPADVTPQKPLAEGPATDVLVGRLYFDERRFIEAAHLLSAVLDKNPTYPEARNLLARCFFFLGNPDRTVAELEFVLANQKQDHAEVLDALFLIGAAVIESPGPSRENLLKAEAAWKRYLQLAPDSPQKPKVEEGLAEIQAGLKGEGRLAQGLQIASGQVQVQAPQNVMGGAQSFSGQPAPAGPGGQAAAPAEKRVPKLPADATPLQRAVAEGLDALDAGDIARAEGRLKAADGLRPNQVDVLTGLGRVYVRTGRIGEALRVFGQAIKVNPTYMPAWHYNGMAHMMSGDPKQAAESWEHIKEADPDYFAKYGLDRRVEVARCMVK
jgi:tetratricopeptide (TPR) repeat protein